MLRRHALLRANPRFLEKLRHIQRYARDLLKNLIDLPGRKYADLYVHLKLNQFYHRLRIPLQLQVWLVPRQLYISQRLMHQPYFIRLGSIKWGGRPRDTEKHIGTGIGCGFIFGGNWDIEKKTDIDTYLNQYIYSKTVFDIFRDNISYRNTPQYMEMLKFVRAGTTNEWQARGCTSKRDIDRYFQEMRLTFESIRKNGYKNQKELGSNKWFDEIKVFIDRNGDIHKQQGAGHHRLAMAKLLNLEYIPVLVLGVHRDYAMQAYRRQRKDIITSIDREILATLSAASPEHTR